MRGEHKPLDTKMICEMHQKKITEEWNPAFMYGRSKNWFFFKQKNIYIYILKFKTNLIYKNS